MSWQQTNPAAGRPGARPGILSLQSYPRLLDLVIAYCDPSALLALRATSRALLARINTDMPAHIVIRLADQVHTPGSARPLISFKARGGI
jgi:hypothetical protein